MSTPALDKLLDQCHQPKAPVILKVATLSKEEVDHLVASLKALDIQARVIDGARITKKSDLLRALATAFAFPSYFGHNWDALLDCWSDFSWLPAKGWVCILLDADTLHAADAQTHDALLSTVQDAADRWREHDPKAVFKLIHVAGPAAAGK